MKKNNSKSSAFLATSDEDYSKFNINKDSVQIWENGLRTNGDRGSFEWWYVEAKFEDGSQIITIFFSKNKFMVKDVACPTAYINIILPNGEKIYGNITEGENKIIKAEKNQCHVKINDSYLKYINGNYKLRFVGDDLKYEVDMISTMPMWRPATGHWFFGKRKEKYFAWLVAQPSCEITGTLTINDRVIHLKGTGYHDHNWGNIDIHKIINHWYWGHCKLGNYILIASDIITHKKFGYTQLPVIMIAKDDKIIEDNQSKVIISRSAPYVHNHSKNLFNDHIRFELQSQNGTEYLIEFNRLKDIIVTPLVNASGIKALYLRLLGKFPTYIRSSGQVKLTIVNSGITNTLEAESTWEQMFLGKNKESKMYH